MSGAPAIGDLPDRLVARWHDGEVPRAVKVASILWLVVWVPAYARQYGPANFLWFCDAGIFVLVAAIWWESAYLFASQAVGMLIIQLLWCVDYFAALLFGVHPIGGTEYMFDASIPLFVRSLSLFHVAVPVVLLWALRRFGYHRRGWRLELVLIWVLLVPSFFLGAEPNLNWIWRPFGVEPPLPDPAWPLLAFVLYPAVILGITHAVLRFAFRPAPGPAAAGSKVAPAP